MNVLKSRMRTVLRSLRREGRYLAHVEPGSPRRSSITVGMRLSARRQAFARALGLSSPLSFVDLSLRQSTARTRRHRFELTGARFARSLALTLLASRCRGLFAELRCKPCFAYPGSAATHVVLLGELLGERSRRSSCRSRLAWDGGTGLMLAGCYGVDWITTVMQLPLAVLLSACFGL